MSTSNCDYTPKKRSRCAVATDDKAEQLKAEVETISLTLGRIHPRREPPTLEDADDSPLENYASLPSATLEKRAFSLVLAWIDIGSAWSMLDLLSGRPTATMLLDLERRAFVDAAVVAYSRPFAPGKSRLPPIWPGYRHSAWTEHHEELVRARHAFVAHGDFELRKLRIARGATPDAWETTIDLPMTMMRPGDLELTQAMCTDLWNRLKHQVDHAVSVLLSRTHTTEIHLPRARDSRDPKSQSEA